MSEIKSIITNYNSILRQSSNFSEEFLESLENISSEFIEGYKRNNQKKKVKGKYPRPRGRGKKGKVWNENTGEWDEINKPSSEYDDLKLSELRKLAVERGIAKTKLDDFDDSDNPKPLLINYLESIKNDVDTTPVNEKKEDDNKPLDTCKEECILDITLQNNDGTITYQGVEYIKDCITNELTDQDTYDTIGVWINDHIKFYDGMEEKHNSNDNYIG